MRQEGAGLGGMRRRRARLVVPQVHVADLEQVRWVVQPVDVGAHRLDKARQQHGAHHRLCDAHRVAELDGSETYVALGQSERIEGVRRHERVGDGLVEAAAGQGALHSAPHLLRLGQTAGRAMPRERLGRQIVAGDAPDLLDEVDLADKVGAERRGRDRPLGG